MQKERVRTEVQLRFLYSGMILKGDAYTESNLLVLKQGETVTDQLVADLSSQGCKSLFYVQEQLRVKKNVSKSIVNEKNLDNAMELVDDIRAKVRNQSGGLPQKQLNEVVGGFVSDIKGNADAYLNLLELLRNDDYYYTHSINVSTIGILLGNSLKLDDEALTAIGISGMLHDIGRTQVPQEIWEKTGKLTPDEWKMVQGHPVYGYNMLKAEKTFDLRIEKGVLLHHENYRGGGYPLGATHEKLDPTSQILAIADSFDALTSVRPHKRAWAYDEAFAHLMEHSGTRFHPHYIQVFLRDMVKKINEHPLYNRGDYLLMNTGEVAFVHGYRNSEFTLRPIINIFFVPVRGENRVQQAMKYLQQVDLEQDFQRFIVKKILDPVLVAKFDQMLGERAPAHSGTATA